MHHCVSRSLFTLHGNFHEDPTTYTAVAPWEPGVFGDKNAQILHCADDSKSQFSAFVAILRPSFQGATAAYVVGSLWKFPCRVNRLRETQWCMFQSSTTTYRRTVASQTGHYRELTKIEICEDTENPLPRRDSSSKMMWEKCSGPFESLAPAPVELWKVRG